MKQQFFKYHKIAFYEIILLVLIVITSCKKADNFLNAKLSNADVVPTTLQDLQAVLDDNTQMNGYYPEIALAGTDNLYITSTVLSGATLGERNSYIWAADIYEGGTDGDWNSAYTNIEYANIVLDGLSKITTSSTNLVAYNNVKGSALFYRSIAFYYLAQMYCKPYDSSTASTDLGIPLRLSSDVNIPSVRSTVQATYSQMINDLKIAISLLPVHPIATTRPSQISANALLAKVYLDMGDYTDAGTYANNSLALYNTLLDFNNTSLVSPTSKYHFPTFNNKNPEISFYATGDGFLTIWAAGTGCVDTTLYKSYTANDLRSTLYYTKNGSGLFAFYGSYTGSHYNFNGIATNEVYLIRAECYARTGNTSAAMADLNTLLVKRWITGTFIPYTAANSTDALTQILTERRKELPFTGLIRWDDLRRLNKDPNYAVTITHIYNGTTYTLPPNDERYVYPIPDLEIQQYGLQQNPR